MIVSKDTTLYVFTTYRLCLCSHLLFFIFCICVSPQDMLHLEAEVKSLHAAVDQIQVTLASPDLNRLSLREQLTQRQVTHINCFICGVMNWLRVQTKGGEHICFDKK